MVRKKDENRRELEQRLVIMVANTMEKIGKNKGTLIRKIEEPVRTVPALQTLPVPPLKVRLSQ